MKLSKCNRCVADCCEDSTVGWFQADRAQLPAACQEDRRLLRQYCLKLSSYANNLWQIQRPETVCLSTEACTMTVFGPDEQMRLRLFMANCPSTALWEKFFHFFNLKSSYHLLFCNSGGDSRAVLCAGLNSPLQSHPNKAGYTTITTQGYAFLKQHLCISL